jgi:hypothetical protein
MRGLLLLQTISQTPHKRASFRSPLFGLALTFAVTLIVLLVASTCADDNSKISAAAGRHLLSFPNDAFTLAQLKAGAIILHVVCGLVVFALLALVVEHFMEPACTAFVKAEGISAPVADATVYSFANGAPEVFVMLFATLVASPVDDIGVATVFGGCAFNQLLIPAVIAFTTDTPVSLNRWVTARDAWFYMYVAFLQRMILIFIVYPRLSVLHLLPHPLRLALFPLTAFITTYAIMWWHSCILLGIYWV